MNDHQHVTIEVRREPTIRAVLIGTALAAAFVASLAYWGPYWIFDAANWIGANIVAPISDWLTRTFADANENRSTTTPNVTTPS